MWHKHHEREKSRFSEKSGSEIQDINIGSEDVEKWRNKLKKLGLQPLEIEEVMEKSEEIHQDAYLTEQNFKSIVKFLENKRGRPFTSEEIELLKRFVP